MVWNSNGYTWRGQRTEWWPNSGCVQQTRCRGKDLQPQILHRIRACHHSIKIESRSNPETQISEVAWWTRPLLPRTERILGPARRRKSGRSLSGRGRGKIWNETLTKESMSNPGISPLESLCPSGPRTTTQISQGMEHLSKLYYCLSNTVSLKSPC